MPNENLFKLAQQALNYSRSIIKHSYSEDLKNGNEVTDETYEAMYKSRYHIYSNEKSLQDMFRVSVGQEKRIFKTKRNVAGAILYEAGNCGEYADLALNFLRKHNVPRAEEFYIVGRDHVFVVIGRLENSDPNIPSGWGEDAIVCDPWLNKIYYASEITSQLLVYNLDSMESEYYQPKKHRLSSRMFIGHQSDSTKEDARQEAIAKLNIISQVLYSFNKNHSIEDISASINILENMAFSSDESSLQVSRKISKIVRENLKSVLLLSETYPTLQAKLSQAFFKHFIELKINESAKSDKDPNYIILRYVAHWVCNYSDSLVCHLLDSINSVAFCNVFLASSQILDRLKERKNDKISTIIKRKLIFGITEAGDRLTQQEKFDINKNLIILLPQQTLFSKRKPAEVSQPEQSIQSKRVKR